jgi:hypothetical protein
MRNKRGQIFSSDFLIGIIVFLFIVTALQVHHSNILNRINHHERMLYHETLLSRTDTLVLSEGIPPDWNETNVEVLGFSTGRPNRISETKVKTFINLSNRTAASLLGLDGRDFYISVENSSDVMYSYGGKGWEDAENVYTVKRKVFLENSKQTAFLKMVVW